MIEDGGLRWVFLGVSAVLAGAAVVLRPDESVAGTLGLLAGLCVAAFAFLALAARMPRLTRPGRALEVASIVTLRQSFRDGRIGQQRIAEALAMLERNARTRSGRARPETAKAAPEERSADEFRRWVVERLDELERTT